MNLCQDGLCCFFAWNVGKGPQTITLLYQFSGIGISIGWKFYVFSLILESLQGGNFMVIYGVLWCHDDELSCSHHQCKQMMLFIFTLFDSKEEYLFLFVVWWARIFHLIHNNTQLCGNVPWNWIQILIKLNNVLDMNVYFIKTWSILINVPPHENKSSKYLFLFC